MQQEQTSPPAPPATSQAEQDQEPRRAYRYSFISLGARVVLQAVSGIVIARELGPRLFGLGILVVSFYTVVSSFVLQGANGPLIVRSLVSRAFLRRTAVVDLGLAGLAGSGLVLAGLLWDGGGWAGRVGLLVAAGGCLVQGVSGPAVALSARGLRFDRIARGEVLGALCGAGTGIVIAVTTRSALALPVQAVLVDVVILVAVAPSLRSGRRELARLPGGEPGRRYAVQTGANQLASLGARNVDNYLVAGLLGQVALGVYVLAYRLMMLPIQNIAMVLTRVLVPRLRQIAGDRAQCDAEVRVLLLAVAALTGPATGAALPLTGRLFDLVFGPQWSAAATPTLILLLAAFPQCAVTVCASVLASSGRSREQLMLTVGSLLAAVVAVVTGASAGAGVVGVTVAYLAISLVMCGLVVQVTHRTTGLARSTVVDALGFHVLGAAVAAGAAAGLGAVVTGNSSAALVYAAAVGVGAVGARLVSPARSRSAFGFWRGLVGR